ncbi:hypothetical protein C1280_11615 [Gemmata obscuriglobus]|uniref:Uncharacterized protein n=1 Tax=Gemmata obscuriglobus TaxID=114 RepID=A0A2Z3GT68_9BACT|nr:hypothetical protein C1280_11615 [Gemmata obscuriglobus]
MRIGHFSRSHARGAPRTPNPALHLTPPASLGRTANCMMAVQVSFMFGTRVARSRVRRCRACGPRG